MHFNIMETVIMLNFHLMNDSQELERDFNVLELHNFVKKLVISIIRNGINN